MLFPLSLLMAAQLLLYFPLPAGKLAQLVIQLGQALRHRGVILLGRQGRRTGGLHLCQRLGGLLLAGISTLLLRVKPIATFAQRIPLACGQQRSIQGSAIGKRRGAQRLLQLTCAGRCLLSQRLPLARQRAEAARQFMQLTLRCL